VVSTPDRRRSIVGSIPGSDDKLTTMHGLHQACYRAGYDKLVPVSSGIGESGPKTKSELVRVTSFR